MWFLWLPNKPALTIHTSIYTQVCTHTGTKNSQGAREMPQWSVTLAAFAEDLVLIPSTHLMTHSCPVTYSSPRKCTKTDLKNKYNLLTSSLLINITNYTHTPGGGANYQHHFVRFQCFFFTWCKIISIRKLTNVCDWFGEYYVYWKWVFLKY